MNWWRTLRESRRLSPQMVEQVEPDERLQLGEALRSWLEAAFSGGDGAEQLEAQALVRLRGDPDRSLRDIATAHNQAGEDEYLLRWALVYGASQLRVPVSLDFLAGVLDAEIPPERSSDIHHSTVAEETTIRCQAVRGLAGLASGGDARARGSLLSQLSHPSLTVRVIACQAVRDLEQDPVAEAEIRRRLPDEDAERVLNVRRLSVDELEPLLDGTARVRAPRPPGGESGTDLDLGAAQPPAVSR
jgi:hypothetical protein